MFIQKLALTNFKRFSDLVIENIPSRTKLVLLIGSNGSGKSSVFDAFDWISKGVFKKIPYGDRDGLTYYRKEESQKAVLNVEFADGSNLLKEDWNLLSPMNQDLAKKFIGRSSIRTVPRILNNANPEQVASDTDSPPTFIENDLRFFNDVHLYIQSINRALREPVFSGKQVDVLKIFQDFIEPFNTSLSNIFGNDPQTTIRIAEFEDATPQTPAKLVFQKGSYKVNYNFLSHGEKQVVILLLNFIVRQEYYKDAILFIDEMDLHLNTRLQYNTLKEIVERWIPDSSQLWTATHALGFIDYTNDYEKGVIIDFDDLDFDQPQVLAPSEKNNYQIFELAVSKEFIDKAFQGRTIFFAEQKDAKTYNDLSLPNTFFFDGKDKLGAFQKAKNLNLKALIDRDYLTDDEVIELREIYPFLYILPYYCIENLLFHPENLEEFYASAQKPYDKNRYIQAIQEIRDKKKAHIASGIAKARDGYPFFKENERNKNFSEQLHRFKNNTHVIVDMLESEDFETFFKVLSAKDHGKTLPERQNLSRAELARTRWFRQKIEKSINP
ncbi:MAG: AAA family ATPase [Bacteroidia bacterium]|nr:AAA family ATPase [Bacteroidia bacterium]